jgi:hypothetical protein
MMSTRNFSLVRFKDIIVAGISSFKCYGGQGTSFVAGI